MFKPNENTLGKLLKEILLFQFKGLKFRFGNQNIIRTHKFFEYITYLEENDFLNINKQNHNKIFYTLTDWGKFWAVALIKRTDSEKEYAFLNERIEYKV